MKADRNLDFRKLYPDIYKDNIEVIQKYYEKIMSEITADNTAQNYTLAIKAFCEQINNKYMPLFEYWDYGIAKQYLEKIDVGYVRLMLVVKCVKEILAMGGCTSDLEKLTAANLAAIYHGFIYNFGVLEKTMRTAFRAYYPETPWSEINDTSNSIIIAYLLWLGFTTEDIIRLKKSDYSEQFGVLSLSMGESYKRRSFADEPELEKYLKRYIHSNTYVSYNGYHNTRQWEYAAGDSLLKRRRSNEVIDKTLIYNDTKKISQMFGITAPEILRDGRLNRLYVMNKARGIKIDKDNIGAICEELSLPIPNLAVYRQSEVGDLIIKYESYKNKRETFEQDE